MHVKDSYTRKEDKIYFSPLHSCQYGIFLYFLSNLLYIENMEILAEKFYILNKIINCVELYYKISLPDIFYMDHPLGSIMGRARFSDYFSFVQNCTIGSSRGIYPVLDHHVLMLANSAVMGKCSIGHHVVLAANACVINEDVTSWSLVFGQSPHLVIKPIDENYFSSLHGFIE